jgi:purine-binding chemotaxis protein CheW
MKIVAQQTDNIDGDDDSYSLCSMYAGEESFGIDTGKIREVLGNRELERVPMAPAFVAGVVPYRGDVLTTVSFRALLGLPESTEAGCVLVLEDDAGQERFGLLVDAVGGVVTVNRRMLEANPCTLESRCKWLFDGAYKMPAGLMVQLDPQKLRPSRLAEIGMFSQGTMKEIA